MSHVELGERLPEDRDFAEVSDTALGTDGLLARLWDFAIEARTVEHEQAHQTRLAVADLASSAMSPIVTGDIILVPYIVKPDTVAYMPMTRRAFVAAGGLATASLASGLFDRENLTLADRITADILSGDPHQVTTAQTSHAVDLTVASLLSAEGFRPTSLTSWMTDGRDPTLRVNAAGIAAKTTLGDHVESAISALTRDPEIRQRYLTAVLTRVCPTDWATAHRWSSTPRISRAIPPTSIEPLTKELQYHKDAGARWCAAYVLADAWADSDHPAANIAANALENALADETVPLLRTAYGRALSCRPLTA